MAACRRAVLDGVLTEPACQELLLLARSLAVVGYRAAVCSATIFEVVAALPAALVPLVAAREAVRAAAEEALGLPLLVEFTGLICWRPGSSIGWHFDANRPYLQQRTHSAVCYLQHAGQDFSGGTFLFKDDGAAGRLAVHAAPGRMVAYDALEVHSVEPVDGGERVALTLWFTEEVSHSEDARLLAQLAGPAQSSLGLPPSMWLLPDGTDLRLCRLAMAGLAVVSAGRVLLNAEDACTGGGQLQLAVQPAVRQAWLDWRGQQAAAEQLSAEAACHEADAALAAADGGAAQAAAVADSCRRGSSPSGSSSTGLHDGLPLHLVCGTEFGSLQEAVLAAQRWAWRSCPDGWGRERVCCLHLHEGDAAGAGGSPAATCSWVRSCQLHGVATELQVAELRAAQQASKQWLARQQVALDELLPRWRQLGALFTEDQPSYL